MSDLVLVTGASAGIGEAYANAYAALGCNLVLIARREDKLKKIANHLNGTYGVQVTILTQDLSHPDAPMAVVDALSNENLEVDTLINNAGCGVPGTYLSKTWDTHRDNNQLMVTSVAALTHALSKKMVERRHGTIINIASLAGFIPAAAGHTLYGAVKAWMIKFSEALHDELKPHNVKVLAVCPGFTYSEFHDVTGTRETVQKFPKIFWMTAEQVVQQSLSELERNPKPIFVPGLFNKFLRLLNKYLPEWVTNFLVRRNASLARKTD